MLGLKLHLGRTDGRRHVHRSRGAARRPVYSRQLRPARSLAQRDVSTRVVSAAGETSGEQGARRAAVTLAERLGLAVTYLPGAHGGWRSDPQEFAERLDEVLHKESSR